MPTVTTNASAEHRLRDLGIELPRAPTPLGAYVEAVQTGNLLFLSGTLPVEGGAPKFVGRIGAELSVEDGRHATRLAALNALALAKEHLGSLDRVTRVVRLGFHSLRLPSSVSTRKSRMPHRNYWSVYSELIRHRLAWSSAWRASR